MSTNQTTSEIWGKLGKRAQLMLKIHFVSSLSSIRYFITGYFWLTLSCFFFIGSCSFRWLWLWRRPLRLADPGHGPLYLEQTAGKTGPVLGRPFGRPHPRVWGRILHVRRQQPGIVRTVCGVSESAVSWTHWDEVRKLCNCSWCSDFPLRPWLYYSMYLILVKMSNVT